MTALDESVVRMYGAHVRAAHEGLFLRRMVYGSLPLGFTGEPVPGEFTKRQRRRRIIVDPETAPWIVRVFDWYVTERISMDEIARRLNDDLSAPAPNKSLTGLWTHALVRKHLTNPCYRGFWAYGATETKWSCDEGLCPARPTPCNRSKSGQFEELRIVSDEIWHAAQKRSRRRGRQVGPQAQGRPQVAAQPAAGLVRLPRARPAVGCRRCPRPAFCSARFAGRTRRTSGRCSPISTGKLALRLTCEKLAELVRLDEALVNEIIAACQREADAAQRPDPEEENQLRAQAR